MKYELIISSAFLLALTDAAPLGYGYQKGLLSILNLQPGSLADKFGAIGKGPAKAYKGPAKADKGPAKVVKGPGYNGIGHAGALGPVGAFGPGPVGAFGPGPADFGAPVPGPFLAAAPALVVRGYKV
jgi:hypothetical protein